MAFNRERALAAAAKYAARGQHDRAAREYQAIVEADPSDIRSWVMLADCLVRAGDNPGAIDRFKKVADFYAENQEPTKAIAVYRQILNLDAGRLDVHIKVAELLHQIGRTVDAIATYEFVAQSYFQAGKVGEGLEGFRMVAELDVAAVAKRLRVAELYSREGRKDEAVEHFRLAAQRLLADHRYDDFIRVAERLLYHKESDVDILRELAEIYLVRAKEPRRALMKLNGLLRLAPSDPVGLELLADTFVALGKQDKAVSVAVELAKEQRKHDLEGKERAARVLKKALGWSPEKPKELQKALKEIEAELKVLRAGEPEVLIDVAEEEEEDDLELDVDIEEGAPEEFGEEEEEEVGEDGYDASMSEADKRLLESRVYVRYRMHEHALHHLGGLLDLEPGNVDALELQADVLDRMGRHREAADIYVRLAQLVGDSDGARAELFLDQALALVPDHPTASMMSSALEALGRGSDSRRKIAAREVTPTPAPAPKREATPPPKREAAPPPKREVTPPPKREVTPLPSLPPKREVTPLPSLPPKREVTPAPGPVPEPSADAATTPQRAVTTDDSGLLRFNAPKKRPPPPPGGRGRGNRGGRSGRQGGESDSSEGELETLRVSRRPSEPAPAATRQPLEAEADVEELSSALIVAEDVSALIEDAEELPSALIVAEEIVAVAEVEPE
ncbi:MAG: tetratricopeptide repeat protein, partial [Myxococcales bacterium]|nr:tetratricopeptide repeat protein [Myxococcales bacterium]